MDAFLWNDKFVTGLERVDAQHHGLVDRINAFGELIAQGEVESAAVSALLTDLLRYAHDHFSEEEARMRDAGIDGGFLTRHQTQHRQFLGQVQAIHVAGGREASPVLFRFLVGWLAFHILGADQQMARQLRHLAGGLSAEEAFARERLPEDASSVMLLDAVDDLMRLVGARNRELERLNQELEQRVEARTAELSTANSELRALVRRLEETQAQLVQAEKMASIGTLASGVAHEINNPIGFVYSNLTTLKEGVEGLLALIKHYDAAERAPNDPQTRAALVTAKQASDLAFLIDDLPALFAESRQGLDRVRVIVGNLKDFSQVDGGAWLETSMEASVETTLKLVGQGTPPGVRFVKEYGPAPAVRCLVAQLNQTVLNLLTNAVQAIADRPEGAGTITLRTGGDATGAWIEVADTGVGMSEATRERAFEPFFSTRPIGKGTGLGLSVAWATAQQHGGRVDLSSAPNVGTTVRLSLPLKGPSRPLPTPSFANVFNTRRTAGR